MNRRGFTLLELLVTLVIILVLASAGFFFTRAARRNSNIQRSGTELAERMDSLRTAAMREGREYVLVAVDAADPAGCSLWNQDPCARYFVLSAPTAAWTLGAFSLSAPSTEARLEEEVALRGGVRFVRNNVPFPRPPLDTLPLADPNLFQACGGRRCFAIRYSTDGRVRPEVAPGRPTSKRGLVLALASDLIPDTDIAGNRGGNQVYGVAIAFPLGVVRTF